MTAVEPSRDARPSTEDRYRARTEFDEVGFGSHCVDCYPGSCLYRVYVRDGRIIREEVAGAFMGEEETNPAIPDRYPLGCNKGAAWSQQIDSPDRVRHPMRRVGERGSGSWEQIAWDEARAELADSLLDTMTEVGAEAILKEGTPEAAAIAAIDRFLGLIGATITDLNGAINDFSAGHHLTFGKFFPIFGFDEGEQFTSDLLLFWHTNPVYTTISIFHWFQEARYNGTETVLISPDVSPSHCHVDYHVPVDWGSDPALALAMCQVIVAEGLVDEDFVRTQTDLSLLVRTDTERFLRQSDLPGGGRDDQFFHLVDGEVVPASRADLLEGAAASLEGTATVTLGDGGEVEVRPLMVRLRDHLGAYTPDAVASRVGTHPEVIRDLARMVASGRTMVAIGGSASKTFHADLFQRTTHLLLALTGNWGRKGSGTGWWNVTHGDGMLLGAAKPTAGPEGTEAVLSLLEAAEDMLKAADPTMTDEIGRASCRERV